MIWCRRTPHTLVDGIRQEYKVRKAMSLIQSTAVQVEHTAQAMFRPTRSKKHRELSHGRQNKQVTGELVHRGKQDNLTWEQGAGQSRSIQVHSQVKLM